MVGALTEKVGAIICETYLAHATKLNTFTTKGNYILPFTTYFRNDICRDRINYFVKAPTV